MDCTCAELTGPGSDATAASKAFFMMPMVSGGKDAFEKSFISGQSARSVSRSAWRMPIASAMPQTRRLRSRSVRDVSSENSPENVAQIRQGDNVQGAYEFPFFRDWNADS